MTIIQGREVTECRANKVPWWRGEDVCARSAADRVKCHSPHFLTPPRPRDLSRNDYPHSRSAAATAVVGRQERIVIAPLITEDDSNALGVGVTRRENTRDIGEVEVNSVQVAEVPVDRAVGQYLLEQLLRESPSRREAAGEGSRKRNGEQKQNNAYSHGECYLCKKEKMQKQFILYIY